MVRRERMETDMLTSVKRSCDDDFNIKQKQVSKQRMFPEHQVVTQWFRSGCSNAAGLQTHAAKNDKTHRAGDAMDKFLFKFSAQFLIRFFLFLFLLLSFMNFIYVPDITLLPNVVCKYYSYLRNYFFILMIISFAVQNFLA